MGISPVPQGAPLGIILQDSKSSSRNPVSVRLHKVLGNNFDDDATKEALQTISCLYVPSSSTSNPELRTQGEDDNFNATTIPNLVLDAGSIVEETVPGESAGKARKNLRRDMENKLRTASRQFLDAFKEVDQRLDELQTHIISMRNNCNEAERQLALAAEASGTLLERAGSLREERQEVEKKSSIVITFLNKFTLSGEEVEAITSRDIPVGQRLFNAMDKTERIRNDCRILMSGEDGPTQAGLDIVAATSAHLELGYEKISRWCSHEFRQMGRDLNIEVTSTMVEAIRRLQQRPELLIEALTVLSQTRQETLFSFFITALTRGGPSGLPRPIELHAHDPLRYVGDMLAWVHQAMAAEQEFVEALLGMQNQKRMIGSVRVSDGNTEKEEWMKELMDACVAKMCVPLKARVQQTVKSQESSILTYKIANMLQFYMLTIHRTIGDKAVLSKALLQLTDTAYATFYESIAVQATTLAQASVDTTDVSHAPPLFILDHAQILREIMTVYQSSLLSDEDETEQIAGFEKILDIMIDPVINICIKGLEERPSGHGWDEIVFVLNCSTFLDNLLEPFSFTKDKRTRINVLVEEGVSILTDEHFSNIMADAGLLPIVEACKSKKTDEPLSHLPGTRPSILQAALHNFSLWLSSVEIVESMHLQHLTSQGFRVRVHHEALERVVRGYQYICEEVKNPENRYEAAATLLGGQRPFGQVHLLRQIFGLEDLC